MGARGWVGKLGVRGARGSEMGARGSEMGVRGSEMGVRGSEGSKTNVILGFRVPTTSGGKKFDDHI